MVCHHQKRGIRWHTWICIFWRVTKIASWNKFNKHDLSLTRPTGRDYENIVCNVHMIVRIYWSIQCKQIKFVIVKKGEFVKVLLFWSMEKLRSCSSNMAKEGRCVSYLLSSKCIIVIIKKGEFVRMIKILIIDKYRNRLYRRVPYRTNPTWISRTSTTWIRSYKVVELLFFRQATSTQSFLL